MKSNTVKGNVHETGTCSRWAHVLEVAQLQCGLTIQAYPATQVELGRFIDDGLDFQVSGKGIELNRGSGARVPRGNIGNEPQGLATRRPTCTIIGGGQNADRFTIRYRIAQVNNIAANLLIFWN